MTPLVPYRSVGTQRSVHTLRTRSKAWFALSPQRERILKAAARLFARDGYHGAGMALLEQEVGLKRGALYHHIGNKESLLYEISRTQLQHMVDLGTRIAEETPDEVECLRRLARALLRNIAAHRVEWTVHYRDFNALTGERLAHVLELRERYAEIWQRVYASGVARGLFQPTEPRVAVLGILGMFNYSYLWLEGDGRLDTDRIADLYCDIVLRGVLLAPHPASPAAEE
jgi:AcrR family transcriptional regulator